VCVEIPADCCDEELDMLRSIVDVPGQLDCAPFAGHVLEPDGARRVAGAERMRRLPPGIA
jgi:hypothetical protein